MEPNKNVSVNPQKLVKKRLPKAKPMKQPKKAPKCIPEKIAKIVSKPPRITRKVSSLQKIEFANEVALEQLAKPLQTIIPPSSLEAEVKLTKKLVKSTETSKIKPTSRKRKHSPILPPQDSDNIPLTQDVVKLEQCDEMSCKPKRKRKQQVKIPEADNSNTPLISLPKKKSTSKVTSDESERESNSVNPVSVKRSRKKGEPKVIPDNFSDKPTSNEIAVPEEVTKTPVKRVRKRTPKKPQIETKGPQTEVLEEIPTKRTKGRPKGKTANKPLNEKSNLRVRKAKKGTRLTAKEIKIAAEKLENTLKEDVEVHQTRSNSVNSLVSNLSWTKDISTASSISSSTTTCVSVTSNDFVRFDNKIPFVQIVNTDYARLEADKDKESTLESTSTASDSKTSNPLSSLSTYDDSIGNPQLNLSTSSLTDQSSRREGSLTTAELMRIEFEELSKIVKEFNEEISKWGPVESNVADCDIFDVIRNATKGMKSKSILGKENLEVNKKVSTESRSLETSRKVIVRDRNDIEFNSKSVEDSSRMGHEAASQSSEDEFPESDVCPSQISSNVSIKREKFQINAPDNFAIPTTLQKVPAVDNYSAETVASDNYDYVPFEDKICEDEDALSLFAESISGIESSRLSSVVSVQEPNVPQHTPYVPEPRNPMLLDRYFYRPTRISDEQQKDENVPMKTLQPGMVEKQNADSSSICKEPTIIRPTVTLMQRDQLRPQNPSLDTAGEAPKQPIRVFPRYQPVNAVKSNLYKGHCFFYLASLCKYKQCRFVHVPIDRNTLKSRLSHLNEDKLIEEYLLTSKYTNLRRKYALLIMQECRRRAATRLLMEMAIDLGLGVVERDDRNLNVNALEITLLHLNEINFDACDDLLTFTHNGTTMCDTLLSCMANSQNFTQFKGAFVKLANFMMQIKRPVDIDIVSSILERVCILPCEDKLVKGMLSLMQNTDPRIFDNTMTQAFEVQLTNVDSNMLVPYWMAKKEAIEARLADVTLNPSPGANTCEARHTSPDTTNLDNRKKAEMAQPTTFRRTINTEAISHLFKPPSNPAPKPRFTHKPWHGGVGGAYGHMRGGPRMPARRRVYGTPANY